MKGSSHLVLVGNTLLTELKIQVTDCIYLEHVLSEH